MISNKKVSKCPACQADAIISGTKIKTTTPVLEDNYLHWEVIYLPEELRCFSCGLHLKGHQLLQGAGLGGHFAVQQDADPSSYFSPAEEYFEEYNNM